MLKFLYRTIDEKTHSVSVLSRDTPGINLHFFVLFSPISVPDMHTNCVICVEVLGKSVNRTLTETRRTEKILCVMTFKILYEKYNIELWVKGLYECISEGN